MKRSTKIITTAVLTFGIIGGAIAYGKSKFCDHAARADYMASYVSEKLELNESQDLVLNALKDQLQNTRNQMKEEMTQAHEQMRELFTADSFDQAKALELLSDKTSAVNANAPDVMVALGNFLDSLNAEQKAKILEFMDHKSEGRFGHRGFGHHR